MISSTTICLTCGDAVDAALLGGVCPRCLLGEALPVAEEPEDFDGHELLGEIARGGMGVVYRARQFSPEREVALKTLRGASLDSPEAVARFRQEADVMVLLDHPAILPVYHYGEHEGIPFFTMKLVHGGTLAERIGDYAGQWRRSAELLIAVAEAVRHAHERGVLHRDLKPGNILFDESGQAYVSDFGIARMAAADGAALTQTRAMLGTPYYLAPEAAAGGARAASVAGDVWSLGVILYEMLAQRRPFEGDSVPAVLRAIAETEPAPLRAVPRDLEVITRKALRPEPARRYNSALDFAKDLRRWLDGRPITARAVPAHERAWLWTRRNPLAAVALAMVALATVAAVLSLAWGLQKARSETREVRAARDGQREQLREALLRQAHAGRLARAMGWRDAGLGALREANAIRPGEDLRDEAVAHLAGFDLLRSGRRFAQEIQPSPDFARYVTLGKANAAVVRRMDDDAELWRLPPAASAPVQNAAFDPQGRWLAVQTSAGVRVLAEADGRELAAWPSAQLRGASADGTWLYLDLRQQLRAIRCADWSEAAAVPGARVGNFNLLPGRTLVAASYQGNVEVLDWRSGQVLDRLKPLSYPGRPVWCGDDLIVSTSTGPTQRFDLRRRRSVVLDREAALSNSPFATRDGSLLLTAGQDGVTQLWHAASGERLVHSRGLIATGLCTDDRRFFTTDSGCGLGEIQYSACVRFLPDRLIRGAPTLEQCSFDLSPDGRLLALRDNQHLAVHELATGRLLAQRELREPRDACFLTFTADGLGLCVGHRRGVARFRLAREGARLVVTPAGQLELPDSRMLNGSSVAADRSRVFVQETTKREVFETSLPEAAVWQSWPVANGTPITALCVSPDRRWIAGLPPGSARVRDAGAPGESWKLERATNIGRATFSPDANWVAFTALDWQWQMYATGTWAHAHSSTAGRTAVQTRILAQTVPVEWSADSAWFVVVSDGRDLELVETGTWRTLVRLHGPLEIPILSVKIAPDGRSLVVLRMGGAVEIWDLEKLGAALRGQGIAAGLPPARSPPATPAELAGEFEEAELPPLTFQ